MTRINTAWALLPPFAAAVCVVLSVNAAVATDETPIDRKALVQRHNVVVRGIDPNGAMAVGNGEFAFSFDVTGLQSFPEYYEKTMPIGILSNWGWHSFPNPEGYSLEKFKFTTVKKHDRDFVYPASGTSHPGPEAAYLRGNPHRFGLAQIGLVLVKADGTKAALTDLKNIEQKLDLWSGIVTSSFEFDGAPVRVETAVHPRRDEVGVSINSPLIAAGRLKVRVAFPYASASFGPDYQDWHHPDAHTTLLTPSGGDGADFARTLDATHYNVRLKWSHGATLSEAGKHECLLSGLGRAHGTDRVVFPGHDRRRSRHGGQCLCRLARRLAAVLAKRWSD